AAGANHGGYSRSTRDISGRCTPAADFEAGRTILDTGVLSVISQRANQLRPMILHERCFARRHFEVEIERGEFRSGKLTDSGPHDDAKYLGVGRLSQMRWPPTFEHVDVPSQWRVSDTGQSVVQRRRKRLAGISTRNDDCHAADEP